MDIAGLVKKSYADYGTMLKDSWYTINTEDLHLSWAIKLLVALFAIIATVYVWRRKHLRKLEEKMQLQHQYASHMRFRKRDKMMFYGRRMLRKVKSISGQAYGGQGRKRRAVMRFAKRLLLRKDVTPTQLLVIEPPADRSASFGHFEKPVFLKLSQHTDIHSYLIAGESLIKVGDPDDSVFIVQTGQVNVFLNNPDGSSITLKVVRQGESVTSLLSFIDVLVGNASTYKTVTARAMENSQVIRLPMFAFQQVFGECPDLLVRVIQVIMVRLQRVTITALHNYLGLSTEYIQCSSQRKKLPIAPATKGSPGHRRVPSDQVHPVPHSLVGEIRPDMLVDLSEGTHNVGRRTSALPIEPIDHAVLKAHAVDGFMQELDLPDTFKQTIEESILIKEVSPGTTLVHQGVLDDVMLIFVIAGGLTLTQCPQSGPIAQDASKAGGEKMDNHTVTIYPGDVVGGLAVLTGECSLYTIRAKHNSRVGLLNKDVIYRIMRERPAVVLDIANSVVKRLSPLVRQCDFALDWNFIESGRAVYRQEETSDSTYIVLNGRLRSVTTHANGKKEIVGEYGKGDLIGIIEMITETPRTTTVMAVRDSELAKLPEGLFNAIKFKYPIVVTQLISLLSHRILGSMRSRPISTSSFTSVSFDTNQQIQHRYSTVAIVAVSDDVPLSPFTYELYHSLSTIGSTVRLTSEIVRKAL
uniref:lysophospholipase n=1 Tax=Anopheles coluzzii TaxID=1518534 RepID=A0A8W7PWA6_ANOCL